MTSFEDKFCDCFHKDLPPPLPWSLKRSIKSRQKRHASEPNACKKGNEASIDVFRFASDAIPVLFGPSTSKAASAAIKSSIIPPKALKEISKLVITTSGSSLALDHNDNFIKKEKIQSDRKKIEIKCCAKEVKEDISKGHLVSLPERGKPDGQNGDPQATSEGSSSRDTLQAKREENSKGIMEKSISNANDAGGGQVQMSQGKEKYTVSAEISGKVSQEHAIEDADACFDKINKNTINELVDETHTSDIKDDEPQKLFANSSESSSVRLECGPQRGVTDESESDKDPLSPKTEPLRKSPHKSREGKDRRLDGVEVGSIEGLVQYQQRSQRNKEAVTAPKTNVGKNEGKNNAEAKSVNLMAAAASPDGTPSATSPDALMKEKTEAQPPRNAREPEPSSERRAASSLPPRRPLCRCRHSAATCRQERLWDFDLNPTRCTTRIPVRQPSLLLSIRTPLGKLEVSAEGRSCGLRHRGCRSNPRPARRASPPPSAAGNVGRRRGPEQPDGGGGRNEDDSEPPSCRKKGKEATRSGGRRPSHDAKSWPCIVLGGDSPPPKRSPSDRRPVRRDGRTLGDGRVVPSALPKSSPQNRR